MHLVLGGGGKASVAQRANIRFFPCVRSYVLLQVAFLGKSFATMRTLKSLISVVQSYVLDQRGFVGEKFSADLTRVLFLAGMHGLVSPEVGAGFEFQITVMAGVGPIVGVHHGQVTAQ